MIYIKQIRTAVLSLVWIVFFFLSGGLTAAGKKGKDFTMQPFQYTAYSISKPTLAGIDLFKGVNFSVISQVGGIMAGNPSSVPLDFLINMQVANPNEKAVTIQEIDYILRVDNLELTRGVMRKSFKIASGKTKKLPLAVSMDLAKLLRSNSAGTVQNMVKNFMGTGSRRTNVTLQIKPTYKAGKEIIQTSRYIPIVFSFEAKN